ncbi:hypothetical protein N7G274_005606 [Stereocaulon virgatum]|uniref:F-box domain-containing protein n=1 Tax=Stereocaulon virgatum TaxID=373712 RepID=A0ABR4ABF6_9LECA
MTSISVYGYNPEMLAAQDSLAYRKAEELRKVEVPQQLKIGSKRCLFLELPPEIREHIYSYMLPSTSDTPRGLAWDRAAPIWATNHQIYNECIGTMYGNSTFLLDVGYNYIDFIYQYRLPSSNLVAKRLLSFPERIAARNRPLMRKFEVWVKELDGYTGMIKYNFSNPEVLAMGVREQTQKLCGFLQVLPEVRELKIIYTGNDNFMDHMGKLMMLVLEPFRQLEHVCNVVFETPGLKTNKSQGSFREWARIFMSKEDEPIIAAS